MVTQKIENAVIDIIAAAPERDHAARSTVVGCGPLRCYGRGHGVEEATAGNREAGLERYRTRGADRGIDIATAADRVRRPEVYRGDRGQVARRGDGLVALGQGCGRTAARNPLIDTSDVKCLHAINGADNAVTPSAGSGQAPAS